jgi:hypothetical protein
MKLNSKKNIILLQILKICKVECPVILSELMAMKTALKHSPECDKTFNILCAIFPKDYSHILIFRC